MNERQRMQYLETLGVDSFIPRWLLPGARVPHQCLLPEASSATNSADLPPGAGDQQTRAGITAERRTQSLGLVGTLLDTMKPTSPPAVDDLTAPVAHPSARQPDEKAAFSLGFWRVNPQVMVVDSRQPSRALPTEALLGAIVAGLGLAQVLPRSEIQNWPLAGCGDQGWHAAREMIQAFLESRLLRQPVRYLVLMGEDAVKTVLNEPGAIAVGDRVNVDTFACEALVAPSLTELLLEPRRKAMLWRLLAPLRRLQDEQ